MQKGSSKFGGASTIRVRRQIREARQDEDVEAILLVVDSPGGTVAGTDELAREVGRAAEEKIVHAHIDDLGASAAFWALFDFSVVVSFVCKTSLDPGPDVDWQHVGTDADSAGTQVRC